MSVLEEFEQVWDSLRRTLLIVEEIRLRLEDITVRVEKLERDNERLLVSARICEGRR